MNNFQNMTIESVQEYATKLRTRIFQLEKKGATLPKEKLMYCKRKHGLQYYIRGKGEKAHYISKKDNATIDPLANAYYIRKVLPTLKRNLHAAEKYIGLHSGVEERDVYLSMPEELQIKNSNLFLYKKGFIEKWQKQQFVRNPYMPENLINDTVRGDKVRSKSEAMIANALQNHNLPYHIERPLKMKHSYNTIYPDFVILNPNTLEEIYWEHFGMMGTPNYAADACLRIQQYDHEGIKLGINLICTFEAINAPLSSALVESYIKQYLE